MKNSFIVIFLFLLLCSLSFADTDTQSKVKTQNASFERAPFSQTTVYTTQEKTLTPFRGVNGPAYGFDALGNQFLKFWLNAPATTIIQGALSGDYYCGDFAEGGTFYAIDNATYNFVSIDSANGVATTIGTSTPQAGHTWTGMSYDAITGTMWGASTDGATSAIYTIDLTTGATTLVTTTTVTPLLIDIAVQPTSGILYLHDLGDNIYTYDPVSGAITLVGPTGFDANYAQGMDFNPETGELFLAAYNGTISAAELRLVNLTSGNTTLIGPIGAGSGVELCAFGIAGVTGDDLDPKPPTNFTAYSDETTPTSMLLTWTDPTEYVNGNPLTNFTIEIERDGAPLASVASGTETYTDPGLTQYTEYAYDIYAKDNLDSTSTMVSSTWMAGGYPPIMVVSPTAFADTLLEGGTASHEFTIYNNQTDPGPLDYTITENPSVSWLSVSSMSGTVSPNSSEILTIDVNSTGLSVGFYSTEVLVSGNDPFNEEDTIFVTLQVNAAPVVGFTPDSMHFTLDPTGVAYPVSDSLVMTITNTGAGPLTFELTDEDVLGEYVKMGIVDRSYLHPEFNVEIPKGQPDWRHGTPQTEGAGGPDLFGYTWIDSDEPGGPSFNWIDISATGAAITGLGDDNFVGPFPLGFSFSFYGNNYTEFYVGSNGMIGFGPTTGLTSLSNAEIPTAGTPNNMIAWLWDDLDPGNAATHVYYQNVGNSLVIQFEHYFEYPDGGHWVDAEMILYANGNIKIQYDYFDPGFDVLSCTVGIENADGTDGLQVVYNAAYLHDDLALLFLLESQWLSENPSSGTIPPGGSADIWVKADATGLNGGFYDALVHIISNDPVHPDTTMPVGLTVYGTPEISVDPLTLVFDTLLVGAQQALPLNVSNTGNFPLNVTNITSSNTDFTVDNSAFTVGVGQTEVVNVTFQPQTAQTYSETISIFSDDPVSPIVVVSLEGTANAAPTVAVSPDTLEFDLLSNEMDSLQFTISNTGNGPLTFELTDEDISKNHKVNNVDRSYLRPEFNVQIPKGQPDWRIGTPQTEGAGGPDLFGYKWIDSDEPGGPVFNWIDISGTGTSVTGLGDDAFTGPFPIGFSFSYYGQDYTEFYICSNGFLGFGPNTSGYTSLSNAQIPTAADPNNILPWFWDDLNPSTGGFIYYQNTGNQLIVQFVDYPEYGGSGTVTAEVILNSNGSILYQYQAFMNGIDILNSTVGIENVDGTDGLQVVYNAAYLHDNLAIKFSSESSWLSENPISGTVDPGSSVDIWAIANATGLLGGDYLATVVVNSNDPVNPEVRLPGVLMHVTGVPRISVTPDSLVFDSTFVGATPELELMVENTGTDQLIISSITSSNTVFTLDTTNLMLAPFSSHPVMVTFTPLLPGDYSGIIVFETNDPVTPNDTIQVRAVGIEAPLALVNPSFTNPVTVNINDSVDVFINIGNAGGSPLEWNCVVTSAQMSPPMERQHSTPTSISESAEASPNSAPYSGFAIEAPWDLQFSFNLEIASGALGNAGAEFDGTYYYTARWGSNLIHKYDMSGNMVEEFSIPGVTGLRDLAFDGTYFYGGAAANTIYMMDFATQTLIGTISSPVAVRFIAYDDANDAFWVGDWDTSPTLLDRSGTTMATITTGLTAQYGAAYDSYTTGGPYLWIFDQGPLSAGPQSVYQFDINTGTATGFSHNVGADFVASAGIAGGLWIGEGVVGGTASIGGVLQGTPDMFFVYELATAGPTWLKMMDVSGIVGPGDNFDARARIYGDSPEPDTAYVVVLTNDPGAPIINVEVQRDVNVGIGDVNTLPTTYAVSQNYPNPFNPSTTIKYQLPQTSDVQLQIFNVLGQKVRTLVNSKVEAGYHEAIWDGRNDLGHQVASGIYIYKFQAGNFQKTLKLMLLK